MKNLVLLFLIIGCTQKYMDFDVIRKTDYLQGGAPKQPISVRPMVKGLKENQKECFNQWFFISNAEKNKNEFKPQLIQTMCFGSDYLIDARITETWWTVLFFSQSCLEINTYCPMKQKNQ